MQALHDLKSTMTYVHFDRPLMMQQVHSGQLEFAHERQRQPHGMDGPVACELRVVGVNLHVNMCM